MLVHVTVSCYGGESTASKTVVIRPTSRELLHGDSQHIPIPKEKMPMSPLRYRQVRWTGLIVVKHSVLARHGVPQSVFHERTHQLDLQWRAVASAKQAAKIAFTRLSVSKCSA
jgi:hypothetical protein